MLEKKGTQFRLRVLSPEKFNKSTIRIKDVGRKGGMQLITGRLKNKTTTTIQALRFSIKDFKIIKKKLMPITLRGVREIKVLQKSDKLFKKIKRFIYPESAIKKYWTIKK